MFIKLNTIASRVPRPLLSSVVLKSAKKIYRTSHSHVHSYDLYQKNKKQNKHKEKVQSQKKLESSIQKYSPSSIKGQAEFLQ